MKKICMVLFSMMLLMGCKTMGDQESYAAVIDNTSPESHLALVKAVSTAMDGRSVKIAEDALTTSNAMSIMTNNKSMLGNNPINGRIQERPQHFELMLRGSECYLIHLETGKEYILQDVSCRELKPRKS